MGISDGHKIQISLRDGEVSIQLSKSRSVFFRSPDLQNLTYSQFDFALLAALISSLTTGETFHLDYPVTNGALRQFENYALALRMLSPEQFEAPKVICSNVISLAPEDNTSNKRILTVSGGVDSAYAAASTMLNDATYTHSLLVKGFDYPVDNTTGFNDLRRRVENISDELGLQLIVIETNLRDEIPNYGLQHTGALACCLNLMAGAAFKSGAYAADYTAMEEALRVPWGNCRGLASTLTTDQFPISYLGSDIGRTNKIRWLAEHKPNLFRYISVCRNDLSIGGNCGKCEKCARTRLGLMAISDPDLRRELEISLFGAVSDYREFFRFHAEKRRPRAPLFDLAANLPDGEARQLLKVEIDKLLLHEKNIHKATKRNFRYANLLRGLLTGAVIRRAFRKKPKVARRARLRD